MISLSPGPLKIDNHNLYVAINPLIGRQILPEFSRWHLKKDGDPTCSAASVHSEMALKLSCQDMLYQSLWFSRSDNAPMMETMHFDAMPAHGFSPYSARRAVVTTEVPDISFVM